MAGSKTQQRVSTDRASTDHNSTDNGILLELRELRSFQGPPKEFWSRYLRLIVKIARADAGAVAVRPKEGKQPWRALAVSAGPGPELSGRGFIERLEDVVPFDSSNGGAPARVGSYSLYAVPLTTGSEADECRAIVAVKNGDDQSARSAVQVLQLVSDIPETYQLQRIAGEAKTRVEHFAGVLDLMVLINEADRFLSCAMTFCNELAFRHTCERVSLGWLTKGYVRLKAMSHVDRFDKKSESVQILEQTMEEALDQDSEVTYPPIGTGGPVCRDHEAFTRVFDVSNVCSLPLRVDGEPVGVCTLERNTEPFAETEMRLLRLSCDQATRRLSDLKNRDRWFGARAAAWVRRRIGRLLGFDHTWAKVIGLSIVGLIVYAAIGEADYRIKAPVIIRTHDVSYVTAPFNGHLESVAVLVGDTVGEGDVLVQLDDQELRLQEAALIAERNRYQREFEKARAENSLAEMRINSALLEQSTARLDLIRYRLDQSVIHAPFEGIIVEGDLRERIGAPVTQGEILFKLARVDRLYAELEVDESDIHELRTHRSGELALAARPQLTYPIDVARIEPVAVAKEEGNVFIVNCDFPQGTEEWWRPGMTGVAKISAGQRKIVWVVTHRTLEFLRLRLWW